MYLNNVPKNTTKSGNYIWKQFREFCSLRNYKFDRESTIEQLALILKDWGSNMRKLDGTDYKEGVTKTIWNTTEALLQEKFYTDFGRKFDPFKDVAFLSARRAQDTKRKELQRLPEKQKVSSTALSYEEHHKICKQWNEETPVGLQMKFYHIASVELAWRGGEAASCLVDYFDEELDNDNKGSPTGRIKYNPIFFKNMSRRKSTMCGYKMARYEFRTSRIVSCSTFQEITLKKRYKYYNKQIVFSG